VLSKQARARLRRRGIAFKTGAKFAGVEQDDSGVTVSLESGDTLQADLLLVAVGRGPSSEGIGLEEQGIATERGFVVTDERLRTTSRTSTPWRPRRRPAARAPRLRARHLRRRADRRAEPDAGVDSGIPRVTYCDPEVASSASPRPGQGAIRRGGDLRVQPGRQRRSQILQTQGSSSSFARRTAGRRHHMIGAG
jgi:dihydrolipoamide dehydrogenase